MCCGRARPQGAAVPADLDDGQVERVEDALDAAPASTGSVSYTPPNSLIVAVLATVRSSIHKNASRSCSGDGVGNGAPASHRWIAAARSPRAAGHGKPSRTRR